MADIQVPEGYKLAYHSESEKAIINVYRPILSEEEREKRMQELKRAAINYVKICMDAGIEFPDRSKSKKD